jgi:hypothetical protein
MELLPGVIKEERDGYALYVVERLSEELKKRFATACRQYATAPRKRNSPVYFIPIPKRPKSSQNVTKNRKSLRKIDAKV